jgi:phospholipid/cholesterol/gamma-HCH transport system ATP-binding protein
LGAGPVTALAVDTPAPILKMVSIRNLVFRRGKRTILRGINLEIEHGAIVAIVGMSGCGKSTLLRLVAGLERPNKGQILIAGTDIALMSERNLARVRRTMGFVFQGAALFDYMTVYENVAFPLRRHTALTEAEIQRRVSARLSLVGLESSEQLLPSELSGGMQKRVGLARAIAAEPAPQILLYDEPTSGLDPIMTAIITDLIVRVRDEMGVTSVVVTHDMNTLQTVDRIAMVHDGVIAAIGTYAEMTTTSNELVGQFVHGRARGPIDVGDTNIEL